MNLFRYTQDNMTQQSAASLIVYLPISDDCTMLDMSKHAVQNFAHRAIEG